jgi:hypothetical protein
MMKVKYVFAPGGLHPSSEVDSWVGVVVVVRLVVDVAGGVPDREGGDLDPVPDSSVVLATSSSSSSRSFFP